MRLVVQRVSKAKVKVKESGDTIGEIDNGLFVLVGVKKGDTVKNAEALAEKLSKLRVMADSEDKMNLTVKDAGGRFLVVSQFTLYADTSGGNRPSFINAADPSEAEKIYDHFVSRMKKLSKNQNPQEEIRIETGSFGAYMEISCELDGPVTIILEN